MSKHSMNMVLGCTSCSHSDCPLTDGQHAECPEGHRVLTGWIFSLVCALVFVLPILLAATGSLICMDHKIHSLFGGIAGFFAGFIISTAITRFCAIEK